MLWSKSIRHDGKLFSICQCTEYIRRIQSKTDVAAQCSTMKRDIQLDRRPLKNTYRDPFKIVILFRQFNLHFI